MAYGYFEKNYLTDLSPQRGLRGIFYLHPDVSGSKHLAQFWAQAIVLAAGVAPHD
jgi:hypothetical protein